MAWFEKLSAWFHKEQVAVFAELHEEIITLRADVDKLMGKQPAETLVEEPPAEEASKPAENA